MNQHLEYRPLSISDTPANLQIRLANGSSPDEGRVEVNIGSGWGTVCDDDFDVNAATVVCKMLGYTG